MASDRFPVLDPLRGISLRLRERLIAEGRLDVYPAHPPPSLPSSLIAVARRGGRRARDSDATLFRCSPTPGNRRRTTT